MSGPMVFIFNYARLQSREFLPLTIARDNTIHVGRLGTLLAQSMIWTRSLASSASDRAQARRHLVTGGDLSLTVPVTGGFW